MSNVIDFQKTDSIEQEAAHWLIRLDRDEGLSASEKEAFRVWLNQSEAHQKEMTDQAKLWGQLNVLTELAVPLSAEQAHETGINSGVSPSKRGASNSNKVNSNSSAAWRNGLAAAAFVCSVLIGSSIWLKSDINDQQNAYYSTAIGQQGTYTLADGSTTVLNTDTQIKVRYSDKTRDIYLLQGEAHFIVAKNADKPFRVFAGAGQVKAIGTAFSVYLHDDNVDVTVAEGSVSIASANVDTGLFTQLAMLKAGQSAAMQKAENNSLKIVGGIDSTKTVSDSVLAKRLSWMQGVLVFSGESLENVVEEIGRYTPVSIEIEEPEVRAIRIGGRFPVGDTDIMFDALEKNFGLTVTHLGPNRVRLSSK